MADFKLTRRETETQQSKGQISTQTYLADTVRTTTGTPAGFVETRTQQGETTQVSSVSSGDVRETRSSSGMGKTVTQTEDQGIRVRFKVRLQQQNPIQRTT